MADADASSLGLPTGRSHAASVQTYPFPAYSPLVKKRGLGRNGPERRWAGIGEWMEPFRQNADAARDIAADARNDANAAREDTRAVANAAVREMADISRDAAAKAASDAEADARRQADGTTPPAR